MVIPGISSLRRLLGKLNLAVICAPSEAKPIKLIALVFLSPKILASSGVCIFFVFESNIAQQFHNFLLYQHLVSSTIMESLFGLKICHFLLLFILSFFFKVTLVGENTLKKIFNKSIKWSPVFNSSLQKKATLSRLQLHERRHLLPPRVMVRSVQPRVAAHGVENLNDASENWCWQQSSSSRFYICPPTNPWRTPAPTIRLKTCILGSLLMQNGPAFQQN